MLWRQKCANNGCTWLVINVLSESIERVARRNIEDPDEDVGNVNDIVRCTKVQSPHPWWYCCR